MKFLSIIIPVYNVEKYIRPCLESIFRQGLNEEDFEVIIVNDGTKDNSMVVIKDIIIQHTNITIINQQNQGLSRARNKGMEKATGEYLLFVDSDDLLISNTLPFLVKIAIESQADIIVADFFQKTDKEIEVFLKNDYPSKELPIEINEKSGENLFLEELTTHQTSIWRSLHKKSFLQNNHISFIPNIIYEDVPFTNECFLKASKCLRVKYPFYLYRVGHSSLTSFFTKDKAFDYCVSIAKTWELSSSIEGLSVDLKNKLNNEIFELFSSLICWTVHSIKNRQERIQIIDHMRLQAPNLNFGNGTKQKLICYMYRRFPHTYINLRFIYGIIMENNLLPFYRLKLKRILK